MKLCFFVLNQTEKLDELLNEMANHEIKGATILESKGMARVLSSKHDEDELEFLSSVRQFLSLKRKNSNVIFTLVEDNKVKCLLAVIESVVGSLEAPDTGIFFTVPVDFTKGVIKGGE